MLRSPRPVPVLLAAFVVLLGPLLGGCGLFGGSDPDDAADALATALTKRDVSALDLAGTTGARAQATLRTVLADLADVPAEVTAEDVSSDGDDASGVLVWRWRVAGQPWVTRSPLALRRTDGTWRAVWDVRVIEPRLRTGSTLRATDLLPTRGDVIGSRGRHLVTNRGVVFYGYDKTDVPRQRAPRLAARLARLVGIAPQAFAERVRRAGPTSYVPAITLRDDRTTSLPSESAVRAVDGARITPGRLPLAPSSGFAAQLLGRVGQPTAEMIADAKKQGVTLRATDQVGIGGLEQRYDAQLRGEPGTKISLVDRGGEGTVIFRAEPTAGRDLVTTLDQTAQERAEAALAGTRSPAALVAVRPSTGEILAAANGPRNGSLNAATYGRYAPGSTFKIVSSVDRYAFKNYDT